MSVTLALYILVTVLVVCALVAFACVITTNDRRRHSHAQDHSPR